MSEWNDVTEEDIEIDYKNNEVNIYAGWDGNGSIYAVLSFDQVKNLNKTIVEWENGEESHEKG